jgi:hypothetical protein
MVGAGSAAPVCWAPEQDYLGGTGSNPTYREPGANPRVNPAELSRNLLEIMAPDDPEAQKFLAQQFEGQLDISWILRTDDYHRLLPLTDSYDAFITGTAPSFEWYLGVNYGAGGQATTERQIKGWAPVTLTVDYSGTTDAVRVTASGPFGDEEYNTDITPGTVQRAGDEVPGHGATLSVNSTEITRLSSATITLENLTRFVRGPDPKPLDVVVGNVSETIDMSATYDGPERYQLALGGPSADSVEPQVESVPASLSFDVAGTEVASYDFGATKPDTYSWEDLANNDANLAESVNFRARDIAVSDPTA